MLKHLSSTISVMYCRFANGYLALALWVDERGCGLSRPTAIAGLGETRSNQILFGNIFVAIFPLLNHKQPDFHSLSGRFRHDPGLT